MRERKEIVLLNLSKDNEEQQRILSCGGDVKTIDIVRAERKLQSFLDLIDEELLSNGLDEGQIRILDRVFTGLYHYKDIQIESE
jgi:hypothetical protein